MNSKAVISAIMALSLTTGGFAYGRDHGDRHDHQDHHDNSGRGSDRRDYQDRSSNDGRGWERGAGPNHDFRRGERLPREYRNRQYVVDDWRDHHLSAPPRGYHWVQTGGDYVLVAITTGIILQLLLGH